MEILSISDFAKCIGDFNLFLTLQKRVKDGEKRMRTVTFGTLKGGVGKTMLCFNIGGVLSQLYYKVLIIDSDLQGNLTNNIGVERTGADLRTLYDIYASGEPGVPEPQSLILEQPNPKMPGLDILPSSIFLHQAELRLSRADRRELVLHDYLEAHRAFFSRYDYILIDTNPSMSVVNQNAFAVSDAVLLICDVSMNALEGAQLFTALWEEARERLGLPDNIRGLIVNDFDGRTRLSTDFLEYIRTSPDMEDLRALMLDTIIPRTVRFTESELAATPISLYDPKSTACTAMSALVSELLKKGIL